MATYYDWLCVQITIDYYVDFVYFCCSNIPFKRVQVEFINKTLSNFMCTKDNRIINGLQLEINSALLEYLSWCCLKKKLKRVRKIYEQSKWLVVFHLTYVCMSLYERIGVTFITKKIN